MKIAKRKGNKVVISRNKRKGIRLIIVREEGISFNQCLFCTLNVGHSGLCGSSHLRPCDLFRPDRIYFKDEVGKN